MYMVAHQGTEGMLLLLLLVVVSGKLTHSHSMRWVVMKPIGSVGEAPVVHGHHVVCHFQPLKVNVYRERERKKEINIVCACALASNQRRFSH